MAPQVSTTTSRSERRQKSIAHILSALTNHLQQSLIGPSCMKAERKCGLCQHTTCIPLRQQFADRSVPLPSMLIFSDTSVSWYRACSWMHTSGGPRAWCVVPDSSYHLFSSDSLCFLIRSSPRRGVKSPDLWIRLPGATDDRDNTKAFALPGERCLQCLCSSLQKSSRSGRWILASRYRYISSTMTTVKMIYPSATQSNSKPKNSPVKHQPNS